jgi:hypothetical protein
MKTSKELEAEIARMQQELEKVKELEAGILPDILENFNPKKIRKVLDFLKPKDNSDIFLKNQTESQSKWGIDQYSFYDRKEKIQFGDWVVQVVDQQGGGEGSGEHWHCVFKVEKNGELVGHYYIPGYYQSYNGTEIEWDDIYEVEPYEKMVIDWKAKG